MQTIDMTPSWASLVPLLVELAANATTSEARKTGFSELLRMARLADTYVAEAPWQAWHAEHTLNPVWGPSSPIDGSLRHALSNGMMAAAPFNPDNVAGYHPDQSAAERIRRGASTADMTSASYPANGGYDDNEAIRVYHSAHL